jgi:hypothetical protein
MSVGLPFEFEITVEDIAIVCALVVLIAVAVAQMTALRSC